MACIESVFNKLELKTSFRFIKALLIWGKTDPDRRVRCLSSRVNLSKRLYEKKV